MVLSDDILYNYLKQCAAKNAHPSVMAAIVKTESGGNPWSINVNRYKGRKVKLAFQPKSQKQAENWAEYLDKRGYDFDIGIAQVNIKNVHKFGYTTKQMLDVCTNLQVSSQILKFNYNNALRKTKVSRQNAIKLAISAYNTGNYHSGFQNGYVRKVIYNYSYHPEETTS